MWWGLYGWLDGEKSHEGHEVKHENNLFRVPHMNRYLSAISENHIDIINQAIHDTAPEYDYDKWLQLRLYKIGDKLRENPSMYQLSSEELDLLCMTLNDCVYVLDDCIKDLAGEEVDLRECRVYREQVEDILSILQRN